MRETRLITIAEDYGDTVLCITNLDNTQLQDLLKQMCDDMENGIGRSTTEIVQEWVENERFDCDYDTFITELVDTGSVDLIEIKAVDTKFICEYECYTVNVVSCRVQTLLLFIIYFGFKVIKIFQKIVDNTPILCYYNCIKRR